MIKLSTSLAALFLCWLVAGTSAVAQQQQPQQPATSGAVNTSRPEVTATYIIGEVVTMGPGGKQIGVKIDSSVFNVALDEKTKYLRLKPGETKVSNAEPVTLAEVGVGDRIMAFGKVAAEQKSVSARHIIVMKKEELTQKQQREREEWQRRGVAGRISAINPQARELTLQVRAPGGERPLTVKVNDKVTLRRYAHDTVRFGDAQPSTFDDLKVGDQIRALGERNADGTQLAAEQIVSGSFRMIGGRVLSVNAAGSEIVVRNIQTERPVTIHIKEGSTLRRMNPQHVPMLLQRRPPPPPGDNPQGPGGGGGERSAGAQEPVERLPLIAFGDLKEGDTVIVSSPAGANPARVTAIVLVAGAEALINQAQGGQQRQNARGPNLSLGLPTGVFDGVISP